MTLICRPKGRGNWAPVTFTVKASKHSPLPLEVHVGQTLKVAGRELRISKVLP